MRNMNVSCQQRRIAGERKKRAAEELDNVFAENHQLEEGATYRYYVVVSVPRYDGHAPYMATSRFSEPFNISYKGAIDAIGENGEKYWTCFFVNSTSGQITFRRKCAIN